MWIFPGDFNFHIIKHCMSVNHCIYWPIYCILMDIPQGERKTEFTPLFPSLTYPQLLWHIKGKEESWKTAKGFSSLRAVANFYSQWKNEVVPSCSSKWYQLWFNKSKIMSGGYLGSAEPQVPVICLLLLGGGGQNLRSRKHFKATGKQLFSWIRNMNVGHQM